MEALKQMDLKQGYCFKAWLAKGTLGRQFHQSWRQLLPAPTP